MVSVALSTGTESIIKTIKFKNNGNIVKKILKKIFNFYGYELRRLSTPSRNYLEGMKLLNSKISVETVIDVGVASGTPELYSVFSGKNFILVEANNAFQDSLLRLTRKLNAKTFNVFCGKENGVVTFQVGKDLNKGSALVRNDIAAVNNIEVEVRPLDDLVSEAGMKEPYLLKIDVEGAELMVLEGAKETLLKSRAVIIEGRTKSVYDNEKTFDFYISYMKKFGFRLVDLISMADDKQTGLLLQMDLVFIKE